MDWKEKGRHWSLPVIHAHTKHNSPSEVDNGLEGKGERHWSLPIMYMHTQDTINSPTDVDNGLGEKGERHWSLPVINTHKPQLTGSRLIIDWEEKGRGIGHFQSCTCTHKTQLTT